MSYPVTAFFAGINGILFFYLSLRVIGTRRRLKVVFGDGDQPEMVRIMRGHANAAEYIPLLLILLFLLETSGAPIWVAASFGALVTLGRLSHALYFAHQGTFPWQMRVAGMHLTLWPLLLGAAGLLAHAIAALIGVSGS